eukprot:TRINITY_DN11052_c0_g1_i2.p1 TRINITY_DN11052_c0_g1~~TRINITY_DN11052_c0_g1_i2.p1  ORF type:complete len:131 (-),score=20.45 TRINITY_DN11052_c0_g1_i2:332-724(-)
MKLKGLARLWWKNIDDHNEQMGRPPITRWEIMKKRLEDKFLPSDYIDSFNSELCNLQQGSMTVDEYTHKFHELCIRCKTNEDDRLMVTRYQERLRPDIQDKLAVFDFATVDAISSTLGQTLRQHTGATFW